MSGKLIVMTPPSGGGPPDSIFRILELFLRDQWTRAEAFLLTAPPCGHIGCEAKLDTAVYPPRGGLTEHRYNDGSWTLGWYCDAHYPGHARIFVEGDRIDPGPKV